MNDGVLEPQRIGDLAAEPGAPVALIDGLAVVAVGLDVRRRMAGELVGRAGAVLGRAVEAERGRELMQQSGVVAVAVVLVVELPVAGKALATVAEHHDRLGEQAVEEIAHRCIEIVGEGFGVRVEGAEDGAAVAGDLELAQAVRGLVEVLRHAACARRCPRSNGTPIRLPRRS